MVVATPSSVECPLVGQQFHEGLCRWHHFIFIHQHRVKRPIAISIVVAVVLLLFGMCSILFLLFCFDLFASSSFLLVAVGLARIVIDLWFIITTEAKFDTGKTFFFFLSFLHVFVYVFVFVAGK